VTVNVTARLPAGALVGEIELAPGAGFLEEEEEEEEDPPPPHAESRRTSAPINKADRRCRRLRVFVCRTYRLQQGLIFSLIISVPFLTDN
jgi:hypothetical protein